MRMDGCPRAGPRGVSQRRQRAVVLSRSLIAECRFWGQRLGQTSQRPSQPGPQKWTISQASDVTARYASAGHVPPCRAGVERLDGEQGDLARDTWGYKGGSSSAGAWLWSPLASRAASSSRRAMLGERCTRRPCFGSQALAQRPSACPHRGTLCVTVAASKENGPPSSPCRARQPQRDSARVPVLSPHKQSRVLLLHAASISSGPCVSVHARVCVSTSRRPSSFPLPLSFPFPIPATAGRITSLPPLCTSHCPGFPAFACGFQIPKFQIPSSLETGDWRLETGPGNPTNPRPTPCSGAARRQQPISSSESFS